MSLRRWTHRAIECSEVDTSIRMDTSWSSRDTGMLDSLPIVPVPIGNQWASSAERVVPPSLSPPPANKNAHCKTAQQRRVYSGVAGTVQRYDAYSLAGGSVEAERQSRGRTWYGGRYSPTAVSDVRRTAGDSEQLFIPSTVKTKKDVWAWRRLPARAVQLRSARKRLNALWPR